MYKPFAKKFKVFRSLWKSLKAQVSNFNSSSKKDGIETFPQEPILADSAPWTSFEPPEYTLLSDQAPKKSIGNAINGTCNDLILLLSLHLVHEKHIG